MSEEARKQKQKELDSILDAALDELDDSDGDAESDDGETSSAAAVAAAVSNASTDEDGLMKVDGLADAPPLPSSTSTKSATERPQFGPEPPPNYQRPPAEHINDDSTSITQEQAELASSLEGMMQQFMANNAELSGMKEGGDFGGLKDLENAEMALEDLFRQMMEGDSGAANNGGGEGVNGGANAKSKTGSSSDLSAKKKSNATNNKTASKTTTKEAKKTATPDVDQTINNLLDGINQPSPTNNCNNPNYPPFPPSMMDPTNLEQFSEQIMSSLMTDFEKLNNKQDSNTVVDTVMKQLLDKELMYTPMKEVCCRFPEWLAKNKESLSVQEYERYGKQYVYFQKIVRVYETEPENFARLMELMQDIQEYGQPPVEIIKDLAPELEFDEDGMPIMDPMGGSGGMGGMMGGLPPGFPGMPFPGGAEGDQCCIS